MNLKLTYKYSTIEMEIKETDFDNFRGEYIAYASEVYADLIEIVENGSRIVSERIYGDGGTPVPATEEKPVESVVEPPKVNAEPGPTEKQIRWAKNLGMESPETHTKHEVAKYIEEHK